MKVVTLGVMLIFVAGFTFASAPVAQEVVFGTASASNLGDNITSTLEEWVPIVLLLGLMGIALAYLGIRFGRR